MTLPCRHLSRTGAGGQDQGDTRRIKKEKVGGPPEPHVPVLCPTQGQLLATSTGQSQGMLLDTLRHTGGPHDEARCGPEWQQCQAENPRPGPGYLIKKGESQPPASTPLRLPRRVSGQSEPPHKTSPLIAVVQQAQISGRARRAGQKAGRAPSAGARSEPGECCWARPSSFCPVYREYVL